ncbi:FtsX-like permease family protein [Bacillus carboniphilus]|uniref:FtsX-like permease family protein n=1 Tax=Bacillus carboniphilus TaxID=86663 RepID=A0ABP3GIN7_9BACI
MSLQKGVMRTIWKRKMQSLGSIILLMIAVMLYIMMTNSLTSLDKSYQMFKENYQQESFQFISADRMEAEQVAKLEQKMGIELEERSFVDVSVDGDRTLRLLTIPTNINQPYLTEGVIPTNENEVALAEKYAAILGLTVGDNLKLNNQTFEISGLVYLPDYIYPIENEANLMSMPGDFGVGLLTVDGLSYLGLPSVIQYSGLNSSEMELTKVKQEINKLIPVLKWTNANENPAISTFETEVEGSMKFSSFLPLIITLMAIMMVTLLVTKQIEWERKQIGTLKALGYQRFELLKAYISLPLLVGLLGTILGSLLGWVLSSPLQTLYTDFYHIPTFTSVGSVFSFVLAILVPVLLLLVISGIAIFRKVSSDPLTLMKGEQSGHQINQKVRGQSFISKFSNYQTKYRVRAMLRSKSRMFYMLIGSIFSSVTLIFGFLNMNSIDVLFTETFQNVNQYNYGVYYKGLQTEEVDGDPFTLIQSEIDTITVGGQEKEISGPSVSLYGVDSDVTLVNLEEANLEGNIKKALEEGVIINQVISYSHNLEIGDQISLISATNGDTHTFTVQGIVEAYTGATIYASRHTVNEFAGFPAKSYTGAWTLNEPNDQSEIFMLEDKAKIVDSFESLIGPSRYSILITAGIAITIGVLIMSLLTNMILEENTYTISMLKVLGYEDKTIAKMVLNLYTTVVLVGYIISIPISLLAMNEVVRYLASETSFALPVKLQPIWIMIGLLIILLTYQLSLFVSKRKLRKVSLQEVMKHQDN